MRLAIISLLFGAAVPASAAGPISKFDDKPPVGEYETKRPLEEIERCLIDMDGWLAPNVYRQPDKPDTVTLLWIMGGSGKGAARLDMTRTQTGTRIKSWMPAKQAEACVRGD